MIYKFSEFKNENVLYSKNDKHIKELFKEIKDTFDYDNMSYFYESIQNFWGEDFKYKKFEYRIPEEDIKLNISIIKNKLSLKIDNVELNVSYLLKLKILKFFNRMIKEKKNKKEQEILDKISKEKRTEKKYNL